MKQVVGQLLLGIGVAIIVSFIVYLVINNNLAEIIRSFYERGVPNY